MRIFRFEKDGVGPFQHSNKEILEILYDCYESHFEKFPSLMGDLWQWGVAMKLGKRHGYPDHRGVKCACGSWKQLNEWFPKPLQDFLISEGFSLVIKKVPKKKTAWGRKQVFFVD